MEQATPEESSLPLTLHHVGIVVHDLDEAVETYRNLGLTNGERFEMAEQGIVAVTYRAGNGYVELIQPTDPEGAIARFLAKRGDSMHHVAYQVENLQLELDRLREKGIRLIDERPRRGAHGWRIAFIHPESCQGVLTELIEDDGQESITA